MEQKKEIEDKVKDETKGIQKIKADVQAENKKSNEKLTTSLDKHQKESDESAKKFVAEKEEVLSNAKKARLEKEKKEAEEKKAEEAKRDKKQEKKERKEIEDILKMPIPGAPESVNKDVKLDDKEINDMLHKPGPAPLEVRESPFPGGAAIIVPGESADGSETKRLEDKIASFPPDDTPTKISTFPPSMPVYPKLTVPYNDPHKPIDVIPNLEKYDKISAIHAKYGDTLKVAAHQHPEHKEEAKSLVKHDESSIPQQQEKGNKDSTEGEATLPPLVFHDPSSTS